MMQCLPAQPPLHRPLAEAELEPWNMELFEPEERLPRSATPWGVKSSQGERQSNEDAWSVAPAVQAAVQAAVAAPAEAASLQVDQATGQPAPFTCEDLTLFAVYDGHGGREVAQHCADNLHKHFSQHLTNLSGAAASPGGCSPPADTPEPGVAASSKTDAVKEALRQSFLQTDKDLAGTDAGDFVGATATVAVLGKTHIWIAHCGDSRAVIQKNGEAVSITKDHKPDREDEAARVRAAGGRIVFNSGSYRVMGMLAMSRAIGDHFLRPYVIAEPEVVVVERASDDEVLVIATDGLWDVFSCKEATSLAQRCILRSKDRGMSRYGGCRVAASVLTKVAMERGSRDNITVIVVDITQPSEHGSVQEPLELAVPSSAHNEDGTTRQDGGTAESYSKCTCVLIKSQSTKQFNPNGDSQTPDGGLSESSSDELQQRRAQCAGAGVLRCSACAAALRARQAGEAEPLVHELFAAGGTGNTGSTGRKRGRACREGTYASPTPSPASAPGPGRPVPLAGLEDAGAVCHVALRHSAPADLAAVVPAAACRAAATSTVSDCETLLLPPNKCMRTAEGTRAAAWGEPAAVHGPAAAQQLQPPPGSPAPLVGRVSSCGIQQVSTLPAGGSLRLAA